MSSNEGLPTERDAGAETAEARRMEAVGRLAAGIAHDFNNVLAAIRGYGQIALRSIDAMSAPDGYGGPATVSVEREGLARLRADVAAIDESAQRAAVLTRQLATLTRPAGAEVAPLDLDAFAAELHALARRLIPEAVDLALATRRAPVRALANEPALLQASLELLLDLRDALAGGGRVEMAAAAGADRRVALVFTHSAGVAEVPGPRTRRRVDELLGPAGGELRLTASADEATLALSLPASPDARPAPSLHGDSTRSSATAGAGAGATVLLVEDDAAVRRIARTVLERLGYRVVPAGDGGEALRMVELLASDDVAPDLLVTDVTMPAMSGPELAAEVRRRAPGIGVLFMSGMGEPAASETPAADRREDFLQKPFTLDELAARVAGLLAGR